MRKLEWVEDLLVSFILYKYAAIVGVGVSIIIIIRDGYNDHDDHHQIAKYYVLCVPCVCDRI